MHVFQDSILFWKDILQKQEDSIVSYVFVCLFVYQRDSSLAVNLLVDNVDWTGDTK